MKISTNFSALKEVSWYAYAIRFLIGGAATVLTGLIAEAYGPRVGGVFLAFPVIFPASLTLIEKCIRRKKERAGLDGTARGRNAASLDARGACFGAIGLLAFGGFLWLVLPSLPATLALFLALLVWVSIVTCMWWTGSEFRRYCARQESVSHA